MRKQKSSLRGKKSCFLMHQKEDQLSEDKEEEERDEDEDEE